MKPKSNGSKPSTTTRSRNEPHANQTPPHNRPPSQTGGCLHHRAAAPDPRRFEIPPRSRRWRVRGCERCKREFAPRSNRQKFCNRCRPLVAAERRAKRRTGEGWFGFKPEVRVCASCAASFLARQPKARYCSDVCKSRTDRPAVAEAARRAKYGEPHKRLRKMWAPVVAEGGVLCARCGRPIAPGALWDLGHVDGNSSAWSGPEHQRCNRRTSSHRAARDIAAKPKAIPTDDPGRGVFYAPNGERWSRAWFDWRNG
jgi:hypothetical protein